MDETKPAALVHLASGVGNIVLATPLLVALAQMEFIVDVLIHADYPQTADLLRDWSILHAVFDGGTKSLVSLNRYDVIIPAIPPYYWNRFVHRYHMLSANVRRPPDRLFYHNEQE